MMRTLLGSGFLAITLVGLFADRADGQIRPPQLVPDGRAAGFSSVKIIEDSRVRQVINVGRDCIQDKEFGQAVEALQAILNDKKDYYVQVTENDATGKPTVPRWTSAKFEANNLIGAMPAKGLQVYEATYGAIARKLLDAAKKKDDVHEFFDVAQRFRHTKAGAEAAEIVTKRLKHLTAVDPGNPNDWPSWRGNVTNTGTANGSPPLLDKPLWKRPILMDKLQGAAPDNDQKALERVNAAIKQVADVNQPVLPGFFPIVAKDVVIYRSHRDIRAVAVKNITIKWREGDHKHKAGEIVWKSMDMDRGLSLLLDKNATLAKIEQWLDAYNQVPGLNSLLYGNTLLGTLVADQKNVYAINDLAVPPHPNVFHQQATFNPQFGPGELKAKLVQNHLIAFDLFSGKLMWELNSNEGTEDPDFKNSHFLSLPISVGGKLYVLNEKLINPNIGVPNPFGGKPIPFGGESELRLVCIDPTKTRDARPDIIAIQVMGNVLQHNRFIQDIGRRVNAVQLAFSDGVLVCPTNAGEVFGIDLMTRSLLWSYPYRENAHQPVMIPGMFKQPQPFPVQPAAATTILTKWNSTPPAIQDGKIVFTAPDADSVHCVNLRDGKPLWKRGQKKGDVYLAGVFDDRVLIVGETTIHAHDLKNGSQLWSIPTGDFPSGQGAASKGIYHLPLSKGEILAVDIAKGIIKARNRGPAGAAAHGNLVFYENMVLSQTPTELIAYPQLSARLKDAKKAADDDPDDNAKLTDYGDLVLKDGQVELAVAALIKVHARKPADPLGQRVKALLFERLTDLMQIDFAKVGKDQIDVCKDLCVVPNDAKEEQTRKAKFLRLVAQGREAEGNLLEAFQVYKDFAALSIHRELGGIASADDANQKIPVNIWLCGRLSSMIAKAKPDQRAALEAKIAEEWKAIEAKKDSDVIRTFGGMFDASVRIGRDARLRLAEMIVEKNQSLAFLEAELLLIQVLESGHRAEPQTGGRALAILAQLEEKRGTIDSMHQAAAYYRELARDFAKDPVRGAKTGADLLNELALDKRFLPFMVEPANPFAAGKFAACDIGFGVFPIGITGFTLSPHGEPTQLAKSYRLTLDPSDTTNPKMRLRDRSTGQDRWQAPVGFVPMNQQIFFNLYQQANINRPHTPNAPFRFYHAKGNLIVC
ncbi:MAG: hypothetical protein EXR98_06025 [Gemmataceae bacterium]|nr:hypothetical protein [Gemmataceae bacterium]